MKKIVLAMIGFGATFQPLLAQNVGIGTTNPKARLHVADSSVLFSGPVGIPANQGVAPASGPGIRMMWYPAKGAFRAGIVTGGNWDTDKIGLHSFAAGVDPIASGLGSVALLQNAEASGLQSLAAGMDAKSISTYSMALGVSAQATGTAAVAIGPHAITNANESIAIGSYSTAGAFRSHSLGLGTITDAYGQVAVGMYNARVLMADAQEWKPADPVFSVGYGWGPLNRATAMTVLKNGDIGIKTQAPQADLHVVGSAVFQRNSYTGHGNLTIRESGATDGGRITFETEDIDGKYWDMFGQTNETDNASARFALYYHGVGNNFISYGNGNAWIRGTLSQNSDERLKTDIAHIDNAVSKLEQINGYTYRWKDTQLDERRQSGVLAQEIEKVFPEMVTANPEGIKTVNYSALIPYLLEAIKDQQNQINELRRQLKSK